MLFKTKINPVFELQKQLNEENVLLGYLDKENKFETDDKIKYTLIERIFNTGVSFIKKATLINKIMWMVWGFIAGAGLMTILFLLRIIKV